MLIATADRQQARRLFMALRLPFSIRATQEVRLTTATDLARIADFPGLCAGAIGAFEPHVPWNREFLAMRADCYAQVHDPRAGAADADLRTFLAGEALPLSAGVSVVAPSGH